MTATLNGTTAAKPTYDPDFTANVLKATGPNTNPRIAKVVGSLVSHLHDFAREVDLTVEEWMMGVNMINRAGQMSNERRNEGQLLCDVIGLESYVLRYIQRHSRVWLS
jgi:catechol 1,2-dioxygenase